MVTCSFEGKTVPVFVPGESICAVLSGPQGILEHYVSGTLFFKVTEKSRHAVAGHEYIVGAANFDRAKIYLTVPMVLPGTFSHAGDSCSVQFCVTINSAAAAAGSNTAASATEQIVVPVIIAGQPALQVPAISRITNVTVSNAREIRNERSVGLTASMPTNAICLSEPFHIDIVCTNETDESFRLVAELKMTRQWHIPPPLASHREVTNEHEEQAALQSDRASVETEVTTVAKWTSADDIDVFAETKMTWALRARTSGLPPTTRARCISVSFHILLRAELGLIAGQVAVEIPLIVFPRQSMPDNVLSAWISSSQATVPKEGPVIVAQRLIPPSEETYVELFPNERRDAQRVIFQGYTYYFFDVPEGERCPNRVVVELNGQGRSSLACRLRKGKIPKFLDPEETSMRQEDNSLYRYSLTIASDTAAIHMGGIAGRWFLGVWGQQLLPAPYSDFDIMVRFDNGNQQFSLF